MELPQDFDWQSYLINNPDVANVSCNKKFAINHWLNWGHWEGRSYCQYVKFDWEDYLDNNPCLRISGLISEEMALKHFILHRSHEPRKMPADDTKTLLIVTHKGVGGSELYIQELITKYPQYNFAVMRCGDGNNVRIKYGKKRRTFDVKYNQTGIMKYFEDIHVVGIHISQLVGYPFEAMCKFLFRISIPYIITIHDYYWISGNFEDRYHVWENSSLVKKIFSRAKQIIVPSDAVDSIYSSIYPDFKYTRIYHQELSYQEKEHSSATLSHLKIGIIGHISPAKGYHIVAKSLNYIQKHNLPIDIYVFGTLLDKRNEDHLHVTGMYYGEDHLMQLVKDKAPHIFWTPGLWDETYSYVTTQIHQIGKPIYYPDIPIFKERNNNYIGSYAYSAHSTPQEIVQRFLAYMQSPPDTVSQCNVVEKVNREYDNIYDDLISHNPIVVVDYQRFLSDKLGLMKKEVLTGEDLNTYLHAHPSDLNYPADLTHKTSPYAVYSIHHYLVKQTKPSPPLRHKHQNKTAVIIEPREHPGLELVVKNVMHFLGAEWDLHFFCSQKNRQLIEQTFNDWEYHMTVMPYDNLNVVSYSNYMMSEEFWNHINAEHILIFQVDSCILNLEQGNYFQDYLQYAYVGAPHLGNYGSHITLSPQNFGLNGGFSLRRKSAMKKCIQEISIDQINQYRINNGVKPLNLEHNNIKYLPEDIFFCHAVEMLNLPRPSQEVAQKFAVQEIFYPAHAIHGYYHRYLNEEEIDQLTNTE